MPADRQTLFDERIPAEPARLSGVRREVTQVVRAEGLTEQAAGDVALALSEAIANIIEHGYRGLANQFIRIRVCREAGRLLFVVDDDAPCIDPGSIMPRPFEELRPGGLGVHFMRALMNEVAYEPRDGGGNRLIMAREL